ncbi:hypothetical protein GGR58DRAFT_528170 [Xylaria digitata]|nr:hypothetical protein GGR58DRAFT_528170 [Xylaria digitata]
MIDCAKFAQIIPALKPNISSSRVKGDVLDHEGVSTVKWTEGVVPGLSEDELLLCDHVIPGFSLDDEVWCSFELKYIQEVEYDTDAFKSLILAEEKKRQYFARWSKPMIIRDRDVAIPSEAKERNGFVISRRSWCRKDSSESIADYTKRPLYQVGPSELGANPDWTNRVLPSILRLATRWNAIVLIENVDHYLEPRSHIGLQRSSFVSVFLNLLKSHNGIVFLTTNRVRAIDTEFLSRVPVLIEFPVLSFAARRELWKRFFSQLDWVKDKMLDGLAVEPLNGRQIRSMMEILSSLAQSANRELNAEDIKTGLSAAEGPHV